MNDKEMQGADGGDEDFVQEAKSRQSTSADIGLSGFMRSARQTAAWMNSIDSQLEPIRRQMRMIESVRPALDAARRYQALAAPVLVLPSNLIGRNDWHSRINDVARSVSLPRTLLDQLAATAALFLPANLSGVDTEDLDTILDLGVNDGLSLAWAPRTEIVKALLPLDTREERYALLAERRNDVLDDVDASLQIVTHPDLAGMVTILSTAVRTARADCGEGAQALASNVLETAMKKHGNPWIRQTFPQVTYPPKAGHHGTIGSVLDDPDDWSDVTLLQFKHYLVLAGMRNAFGPGASQDTFNRHLTAHQASPDSYRPEFALPAILLAHALLRALNQELDRPEENGAA